MKRTALPYLPKGYRFKVVWEPMYTDGHKGRFEVTVQKGLFRRPIAHGWSDREYPSPALAAQAAERAIDAWGTSLLVGSLEGTYV